MSCKNKNGSKGTVTIPLEDYQELIENNKLLFAVEDRLEENNYFIFTRRVNNSYLEELVCIPSKEELQDSRDFYEQNLKNLRQEGINSKVSLKEKIINEVERRGFCGLLNKESLLKELKKSYY